MKRLVAIAALAVIAIVGCFGHSSEPTVAPASTAQHQAPDHPPTPAPGSGSRHAGLQPDPTSSNSSRPATAPLTEEERLQAKCDALTNRRIKSTEVDESEAKDPNWAYAMEQKLRGYISRKFQASRIQVMDIDCRTTFCRLTAESFSPDTAEEFSQMIGALQQEPWHDFGSLSLSSRDEPGKWIYSSQMIRKPANVNAREQREDEQLDNACGALRLKIGRREQAARDAEPRDTNWAGPMEQMLRAHFTTQLAEHPLDHFEVSCKTSFCLIKADGRTKASYVAFQKVVQSIAQEPWSDLRADSAKGATLDQAWGMEYSLVRDLHQ